MIWSRLWLTLITLLGTALLLLVLVAPRPTARALDDETRAKLERAQQAGTLLLRLNARKWMDSAAQVATDAILMESLEEATRGPVDIGLIHKTVQERLGHFNDKMHVDLVLATDGKGRVIARAGLDEGIYRDDVDGIPLVADGLRGLRGDDTWSVGGRLYRVAASPVIARDRYVGVLVIGQEVTSELAQTMKNVLGVEVAFLLQGRVLATSSPLPLLQSLPSLVAERVGELGPTGGPLMIPVEDDGPGHLVVLSPLAGEAAEHQALYALVVSRPRAATSMGLLSQFRFTDLRTLPLPLLGTVAAGALFALLLGLFIHRLEVLRPERRLAAEAESLARGEIARLPTERYGGSLGKIAQAVNLALDRRKDLATMIGDDAMDDGEP
jgi:hypothetical protein